MKRRFSFAAPIILVAACHHGGGPTDHNPPQPQPKHYAEWNVHKNGDTCSAEDTSSMDCPPDASCNPPPPMSIACPEGITEDNSVMVYQETENGPCAVEGGGPIDCPTWE